MLFANKKYFVNDRSGASLTAEQLSRQENTKAFWIYFRAVVFNHPGKEAEVWYCLYCQRLDPAHFGRTIRPEWNSSTRLTSEKKSASDHHQQAPKGKGASNSKRECQQPRLPREATTLTDRSWKMSLRNY